MVLGDNRAAQIHADNSLDDCTSSHWNLDGLNPDMRYSLSGGYQSALENVLGQDLLPEAIARLHAHHQSIR